MTVTTSLNKIIYPGNGATTSFPFSFPAVAATDIQVFFADVNGNVTLLSPSAYTLVLNPAVANNPTAAGGTVTYNPLGVPIPLNTSLTIMRTLPLQQNTSLGNQQALFQTAIEQALDYLMMASQQVLEVQSRALVVSVSDPTPNTLPAVASRANQVLGFDSNGNPIGVSTAPAGVISSAMQPVVNSATLAAGRTAFGLGGAATEGIGVGLQDDGAGNLRTFFREVSDSIAQSVVSSFHQNVRYASTAITYTFPLTTTLFNGFGFWIQAGVGAVTLAINAADAFKGAATGASLVIPAGGRVFVVTDGAGNWYTHGYDPIGYNFPQNVTLVASVAASALTIALKDINGNDPSPASPILYGVPNQTGGITQRAITSALSITVPPGASLGTVSAQAARIWAGVFDNSGSPILAVYNTVNPTGPSIVPWNESAQATTTAVSAGSTSAQTWYGASGVTAGFRIFGYVEATEATAGTWATAPSKVGLFGPGVKKPGDVVQSVSNKVVAAATTSSTTFVALTGETVVIPVQSAANKIEVQAFGTLAETGGFVATAQLSRGTVANTNLIGNTNAINVAAANSQVGSALYADDFPNTTGNVTYAVQGNISSGAQTLTYGGNAQLSAKEIQV
jgi:hypothetical protein